MYTLNFNAMDSKSKASSARSTVYSKGPSKIYRNKDCFKSGLFILLN